MTDAQLTAQADIIRAETAAGANTKDRVADMFDALIDNKLNSQATQAANLFYSGPTSGVAATPTFRAMSLSDIPVGASTTGYVLTSTGTGTAPTWQAAAGGGVWGGITGTLSAQTDLQSALDAKWPTSTDFRVVAARNLLLNSTAAGLTGTGTSTGENTLINVGTTALTVGFRNTFIGPDAGKSMTVGSENTFTGKLAGDNWAGASENNVLYGYAAGHLQTIGSQCTYLGDHAGVNCTGGSRRTIIGYNASCEDGSSNYMLSYNDLIFGTTINGPGGGTPFDTFFLGVGGYPIHVSAVMEFFSITKGIIPPRMTTGQKNAISSPVAGVLVTDVTLSRLGFYGTSWEYVLTDKLSITEGSGAKLGQTTLVSGTKAITIAGLTTSSRAFVTMVSPSGGTLSLEYQAVCTANTLTIQANVAAGTINTADGSTLNYVVYN